MVCADSGTSARACGVPQLHHEKFEEWIRHEKLLAAARDRQVAELARLPEIDLEYAMRHLSGLVYAILRSEHDPKKSLQLLLIYGWNINAPSNFCKEEVKDVAVSLQTALVRGD